MAKEKLITEDNLGLLAGKDRIDHMKQDLYNRAQVHALVDTLLDQMATDTALPEERPNLDNSISHKALPSDAKAALSVKEAAGEIGISLPKMYELVQTGKFNTVKVGKRILISRQSLMDWLSKGD